MSAQSFPRPPTEPQLHASEVQHDIPGRDPLIELERKIARRADEIAATIPNRTSLNLYCWLQAEQEVLGKLKALNPADLQLARLR